MNNAIGLWVAYVLDKIIQLFPLSLTQAQISLFVTVMPLLKFSNVILLEIFNLKAELPNNFLVVGDWYKVLHTESFDIMVAL